MEGGRGRILTSAGLVVADPALTEHNTSANEIPATRPVRFAALLCRLANLAGLVVISPLIVTRNSLFSFVAERIIA